MASTDDGLYRTRRAMHVQPQHAQAWSLAEHEELIVEGPLFERNCHLNDRLSWAANGRRWPFSAFGGEGAVPAGGLTLLLSLR